MDIVKEVSTIDKNSVIKRLESLLEDSSGVDQTIYGELKFFLSIDPAEINTDFIATCICNNGYAEDYCFNRCKDEFSPHTSRFLILVRSLQTSLK